VRALRVLGDDAAADAELEALRALAASADADPTARAAPALAVLDRVAVRRGDLTGSDALAALATLREIWPVEAAHAARVAGEAGVHRYFRY
jgi:hypothetical protein